MEPNLNIIIVFLDELLIDRPDLLSEGAYNLIKNKLKDFKAELRADFVDADKEHTEKSKLFNENQTNSNEKEALIRSCYWLGGYKTKIEEVLGDG